MTPDRFLRRYAAGERDFTGKRVRKADLLGVDLPGVRLARGSLWGTRLERANLTGADLTDASLRLTNLRGANLTRANLTGADLFETKLERANLSGANLVGADLHKTNLSGANLVGAQLTSRTTSGTWAFRGTVWPTDPELLVGTTIDGVPFAEFQQTLEAIGPNPSPATLNAWHAMRDAQQGRGGAPGLIAGR